MVNKIRKSLFFKETFLLTDINISIVFGILFLTLNNIKINFIYLLTKQNLAI